MNPDSGPKPPPRPPKPMGPQRRISGKLMLSLFLSIGIPVLLWRDPSFTFLLPVFPLIGVFLAWSGYKATKRDPNLIGPRLAIFNMVVSVSFVLLCGLLAFMRLPGLAARDTIVAEGKSFTEALEKRNYESLYDRMSESYRQEHTVDDLQAMVLRAFPGDSAIDLPDQPEYARPRIDLVKFGTISGQLVVGSTTLFTPVSIWKLAGGSAETWFGRDLRPLAAVAASADGGKVIAADLGDRLSVWSVTNVEEVGSFEWDRGPITAAALSANGERGMAGSGSGVVVLFRVGDRDPERTLEGHESPVLDVQFSHDGKLALSAAADRTCVLWDLESGEKVREFEGAAPIGFGPQGGRILVCEGTSVRIEDARTGENQIRLTGGQGRVMSAAVSPDGTSAVTGTATGAVRIFDAKTGAGRRDLDGGDEPILTLAFSSDGARLAAGSKDGKVRHWLLTETEGASKLDVAEKDFWNENESQRGIVEGWHKEGQELVFLWRSELEHQGDPVEMFIHIHLRRVGRMSYEAKPLNFHARSLGFAATKPDSEAGPEANNSNEEESR